MIKGWGPVTRSDYSSISRWGAPAVRERARSGWYTLSILSESAVLYDPLARGQSSRAPVHEHDAVAIPGVRHGVSEQRHLAGSLDGGTAHAGESGIEDIRVSCRRAAEPSLPVGRGSSVGGQVGLDHRQ